MAYTEDLFIYKDTRTLCKLLLKYSGNVSRMVRFDEMRDAKSKAYLALDLIREINSSFEGRLERLNMYIMLIAEVRSRISILAEEGYLQPKAATNLDYMIGKVSKEATGWLKAERKRRGESREV